MLPVPASISTCGRLTVLSHVSHSSPLRSSDLPSVVVCGPETVAAFAKAIGSHNITAFEAANDQKLSERKIVQATGFIFLSEFQNAPDVGRINEIGIHIIWRRRDRFPGQSRREDVFRAPDAGVQSEFSSRMRLWRRRYRPPARRRWR